MTTLVTIQQGGTNANNAANALINLGAASSDVANGAYAQANGAYVQANGAYGQANGAYGRANGAYAQANIVYTQANNAYAAANAGGGLSPFLFLGAG